MIFGITGNTNKKNIKEILTTVLAGFNSEKINFLIDEKLGKLLKNGIKKSNLVKTSRLIKKSNIIISLGGDGTFLNTANIVGKSGVPVLGVNLGNLGFMAEIGAEEIINFAKEIIAGKYKVQDLCVVASKNKSGKTKFGINEVVIDKCNSIRMIEIEVFYNNEKVVKFVADGIIVSTPTGSTGYSLSSGGAIISPASKVFIITPVCPHTLTLRPIVLPDSGIIKIISRGFSKVRQTVDGYNSEIFDSPVEIEIYKAAYSVKVIKRLHRTYFQTLNKKLLWGADKRKASRK
jgi:NAD+ kinase